MRALGPFEARPRLAVGVSGGADSLSLAFLLQEWAKRCDGRVTALTVDHGLRANSGSEARQVASWLEARSLPHRILRWTGPHPAADLQAAARRARYGLMAAWCRRHGVLHLAVAHHLEDQAETLLLRLSRGSGLDGLAAMPAVGMTALEDGPPVRLIRPLLAVPRGRLAAGLLVAGQAWIEDPSNSDIRHARVRIRQALPGLAEAGLPLFRLAEAARHLARARAALDGAVAEALAQAAAPDPAGHLYLVSDALLRAPAEVSLRALARCLVTIGGGRYAPRLERLERLHAAVLGGDGFAGRTLGGCRILRHRGRILVCREAAAADATLALRPGLRARWDGRFAVMVPARASMRPSLTLRRLGEEGWRKARAAAPELRHARIPAPARAALPALWEGQRLLAVPHLGYARAGNAELGRIVVEFSPRPLADAAFTVA